MTVKAPDIYSFVNFTVVLKMRVKVETVKLMANNKYGMLFILRNHCEL